jgi:type IV pilus assembly protein PilW
MEWGMAIANEEATMKMKRTSGFTVIELLVAIALGLVILAGLFRTFKVQHDSYVVQDQVAAMQQNLRAAMYMITRDLQMAGWYTNFDRNNHNIDWDGLTGQENFRPLLIPHDNNSTAGDGVNNGTDMLVIVKAAEGSGRAIVGNDMAEGTSIDAGILTLGGFGATNKYGLLVKNDLRTADFFELDSFNAPKWSLSENYLSGDTVFRTDIIVYKINNDPITGRPTLYRQNFGNNSGAQPVAENIENLQVRYYLQNDPIPKDTLSSSTQATVRAVEVILLGRTAFPQRGFRDTKTYNFANNPNPTPNDNYRRKVLSTIVKTRNVGL